jgi:hypothetical protein
MYMAKPVHKKGSTISGHLLFFSPQCLAIRWGPHKIKKSPYCCNQEGERERREEEERGVILFLYSL